MQFVRQHKLHTAIAQNSSDPFGSPPFLPDGSLRVTRWGFPYVKGRQIACVIPSAAEGSPSTDNCLRRPRKRAVFFFAAVPSLLRAALFFCRRVCLCCAVAVCPSASAAPPPFARLPLSPRRLCLPACSCCAASVCPSASAAPPPFARQPLLRLFCLLVCLCRPAASVCPPDLAAGGNFFPPIFAKGLKPAKKCGILFS